MRRGSAGFLFSVFLLAAFDVRADPQKDLEEGIAAYEDLGLARARQLLSRAAAATASPRVDRAKAYLYLGLLEFDLGNLEAADEAWESAFGLDPEIQVPAGTSPKTIMALEAVRARVEPAKPETPPLPESPPPRQTDSSAAEPAPPVTVEPPPFEQPPPPPPPVTDALALEAPARDEASSTTSPWVWIGLSAGAVAIAAGVLVAVLATQDDLECSRGGGGCVLVTVDGL